LTIDRFEAVRRIDRQSQMSGADMSVKKKILVVDDDPDILEQLTVTLAAAGYDVVPAEGRGEAEEAMLKTRPDLAILDLMMEEKDSGFVLSYEIKKLYPGTPVIMLTAVTGATGLSFASQSAEAQSWTKVDKMMDKPVRPEQLKTEVRRLLHETPAIPTHG
jgi:DNA-binding response OmpR family regulator